MTFLFILTLSFLLTASAVTVCSNTNSPIPDLAAAYAGRALAPLNQNEKNSAQFHCRPFDVGTSCLKLNRRRQRQQRRQSQAPVGVLELQTLSPSPTTSSTSAATFEQQGPSLVSDHNVTPEAIEVARWPLHVRLGSSQNGFTSWSGCIGLLILGIIGTIAFSAAIWVRAYTISHHLVLLLLLLPFLLVGTSLDLSILYDTSHTSHRSYVRSVCVALTYAVVTWLIYLWLYLVVIQRKSLDIFAVKSPSSSIANDKPLPSALRTARLLAGILAFLIGLLEVFWRIVFIRNYSLGWHLQQASTGLQFCFFLMTWPPLARSCLLRWLDLREVRDLWHWLAATSLFVGCALGTGRIVAALWIIGFCESPLGRLILALQITFFLATAVSLTLTDGRDRDSLDRPLSSAIAVEKFSPPAPTEENCKMNSTCIRPGTEVVTPRTSRAERDILDTLVQQEDRLDRAPSRKTPRRKCPENAGDFPIPPSSPAGVPSSVYLPTMTPKLCTDSQLIGYMGSAVRDRAMSLPLDMLSTAVSPIASEGGPGLPRPQTTLVVDSMRAKTSHRGRSSSLGDALRKRNSHDTFMAMRRRKESRLQAGRYRRVHSVSSDMTHLTVTSFFNQFPAPPAVLPIPFGFNPYAHGAADPTTSFVQGSRPASAFTASCSDLTSWNPRASRPFLPSRLGPAACAGEGSVDSSPPRPSGESNCREEIDSQYQYETCCHGSRQSECGQGTTNLRLDDVQGIASMRCSAAEDILRRMPAEEGDAGGGAGITTLGSIPAKHRNSSMATLDFRREGQGSPFSLDGFRLSPPCMLGSTKRHSTRRSVSFSIEEEEDDQEAGAT